MLNILAYGALLVSAFMAALQLQRSTEKLPDEPKSTLQAAALSSLFIGLFALSEILINYGDMASDSATLQRILSNLAYYAALPFLATALLVSARNDHWSRPAWGRWLIGLFAFFELLRRMEHGEIYTQFVAVAVCAAMLIATFMISKSQIRNLALIATANTTLALILTGPGALVSGFDNPIYYPLLLASVLPLIATILRQMVLARYSG